MNTTGSVSSVGSISKLFEYSPYQQELLLAAEKAEAVLLAVNERKELFNSMNRGLVSGIGSLEGPYNQYQNDIQTALKIKSPDRNVVDRVFSLLHIRDSKEFDLNLIKILPFDTIRYVLKEKNAIPALSQLERTELVALRALNEW